MELVNGSDKQYIFIICIGNTGDIANWKANEEYFRYISILQNTTTIAISSYPLWYLKKKKKKMLFRYPIETVNSKTGEKGKRGVKLGNERKKRKDINK